MLLYCIFLCWGHKFHQSLKGFHDQPKMGLRNVICKLRLLLNMDLQYCFPTSNPCFLLKNTYSSLLLNVGTFNIKLIQISDKYQTRLAPPNQSQLYVLKVPHFLIICIMVIFVTRLQSMKASTRYLQFTTVTPVLSTVLVYNKY